MKRTSIASIIMAIVMLVSVMSVGFGASAADASKYTSSESQSSFTGVALNNGTITGTYSLWGYPTGLAVYAGEQNGASPSGTPIFSESYTAGSIGIATATNISVALSDGGSSTTGYTVIASASNGNWAAAYIPYTGPTYLMEIQKNGTAITSYDLGLNEGTASGFSFVYEAGGTYTYSVSDSSIVKLTKSGDTFTLTPVKAGTATITAICNEVSSTTLTVNVVDDSTLAAQWYDTGAVIANNATLSGQATVTYGFGVEAYPDNYTVTLSNNTANAVYSSSSVQGQYPNSIVAANEGSVRVTIAGATKTLAFTVNFTAAPEPVFGFYTDSACTTEAEPMVAIEAGKTATIYANEAVASWKVEGTGASISAKTSTSVTIAATTVDSIVTVRALAADGTELGWFDVYVTTSEGTVDPEPTESDVFVFKINDNNVLYANQNVKFPVDAPAQLVDGKTLVPLRAISSAVGIEDLVFDSKTFEITFTGFDGYKVAMKVGSTDCTLTKNGASMTIQIAAPVLIDGITMLPLRDATNLVGGTVKFTDMGTTDTGYVVVSAGTFDDADVVGYVNAYEAN